MWRCNRDVISILKSENETSRWARRSHCLACSLFPPGPPLPFRPLFGALFHALAAVFKHPYVPYDHATSHPHVRTHFVAKPHGCSLTPSRPFTPCGDTVLILHLVPPAYKYGILWFLAPRGRLSLSLARRHPTQLPSRY
jgi:hypothetical protein